MVPEIYLTDEISKTSIYKLNFIYFYPVSIWISFEIYIIFLFQFFVWYFLYIYIMCTGAQGGQNKLSD